MKLETYKYYIENTISSGQYDIVSRYFYPFSFFYISHETYEYYMYIEKPR